MNSLKCRDLLEKSKKNIITRASYENESHTSHIGFLKC